MSNIFLENTHHDFTWDKLGNIREGRGDLGEDVPVVVYRLMEYSMNHVLTKELGTDGADEMFRKAGYKAGTEFAKNTLDLTLPFDPFVAALQKIFRELRIGVLRVESIEGEAEDITLTVAQDLDCSGLPTTGEIVCNYDEGFLAGVLDCYTHRSYTVREVDCWASGARVCRFRCKADATQKEQ